MPQDDNLPGGDNTTNRKKILDARISRFSEKHHFKKSTVRRAFVVLVVLILLAVSSITYLGIRTITTVSSKTTEIGLKNIGELATQAGYFTNVQTIKGSRLFLGVEVPLTQSKFIYSYDGVIKAGIDFDAIELHVDETAKTISIKLPQVKILSIEIDEKSIEIYDETNNIFNPLGLKDVNLAMIELKEKAQETAIKNGLLENARTNAELLIRSFLSGRTDLKDYQIVFV